MEPGDNNGQQQNLVLDLNAFEELREQVRRLTVRVEQGDRENDLLSNIIRDMERNRAPVNNDQVGENNRVEIPNIGQGEQPPVINEQGDQLCAGNIRVNNRIIPNDQNANAVNDGMNVPQVIPNDNNVNWGQGLVSYFQGLQINVHLPTFDPEKIFPLDFLNKLDRYFVK